ncbi:MAG: acetyl-CoA carboxylase biotin carboxyl carrier protein [Alphaproteobacteria bacterium]|nr:acetyl-CoA carboxylase biotin carboxyl carrier protein [Alphaproteobacteria bacterium]
MSDKAPGKSRLDTEAVKTLAAVLDETGLGEIEYEEGGLRIRVARQAPTAMPVAAAPMAQLAAASAVSATASPPAVEESAGPVIKSPMVGTFYQAASPTAAPFIKVGDQVNPDTVIGIIEAMKVMNEIKAGLSGEVAEILVDNQQPVEFGQVLVRLK